jgi:hypothetical protein
VPTTQLRKRLSNRIRKQTDTGVYLTISMKKHANYLVRQNISARKGH